MKRHKANHKAPRKENHAPKFLIGIDEVGRGPIAGPVTLCAFLVHVEVVGNGPKDANKMMRKSSPILRKFRGIKDSKQLSAAQREEWYEKILTLQQASKQGREQGEKRDREAVLEYAITSISSTSIDTRGLSWAINTALARCLEKLDKNPSDCLVLLDGGLKAPAHYPHQQTIIKGDEKEPVIALASIMAKVTRDRELARLAKVYPVYGFDVHKGYGTKGHYDLVRAHGLCAIHRRSFMKGFV